MTVDEADGKGETEIRVLLLGEGNFSFTLALCRLLELPGSGGGGAGIGKGKASQEVATREGNAARNYLGLPETYTAPSLSITATSFDSESNLYFKYPESVEILQHLRSIPSCTILHGINAWELPVHFPSSTFHRIIWNHPHLGVENLRLHRFLMCHFFSSATQVLDPEPSSNVTMTLVQGQETRWELGQQAEKGNLRLKGMIQPFVESQFPGYVVKRNTYGGSFKNLQTKKRFVSAMPSNIFHFCRSDVPSLLPNSINPPSNVNACNELCGLELESMSINCTDELSSSKLAQPSPLQPVLPGHSKPKAQKALAKRKKDVPQDLKCTECGQQLMCARGYATHYHMLHVLQTMGPDWTPNAPKCLTCKHCDKFFRKAPDLWQHLVNKHSTVMQDELSVISMASKAGESPMDSVNTIDSEYDYVPCGICGQAIQRHDQGMALHLESLKPLVGLPVHCPLCDDRFLESRALLQHYKFCRLKLLPVRESLRDADY